MNKGFLLPFLGILLLSIVSAGGITCCNYECFVPDTLGDSGYDFMGHNSETSLIDILANAGYSVNLPEDQSQIQVWETTQDVEIEIEYLGGISSYSNNQVFVYYLNHNEDSFVPVFKTASIAGYETIPLYSEGPFTINIEEGDYVGFAIIMPNQYGGIFYATENAMNPSSKDRAIVIEEDCDEFLIGFEDLNDWDYQDLVVSVKPNCGEPEPEPMTIIAHKIVCEDESSLPNWGLGGPDITQTTAQDFVDGHEGCEFEEDWYFQWGFDNEVTNPGDNTGEAGGNWHTFGGTNSNGKASVLIYELLDSKIWVREAWDNDYIGFTYNLNGQTNVDDVSAELYCHTDVLNYDNYDFIINPELENEYYCVAFNVRESQEPECGDGDREGNEECDWGDDNGILCEAGYDEFCDYCSENCAWITIEGPYCGDGDRQSQYGEICDDGNNVNGDGCSSDCKMEPNPMPRCGDDIINILLGEECDNGDFLNGMICLAFYGETCDWCTKNCTLETETGPYCGDNTLQEQYEECDDGEENGVECDNSEDDCEYCSETCKIIELEHEEDCKKCKSSGGYYELSFECESNWECSGWGECYDSVMTRKCYDSNNCENPYNKPSETSGCQEALSSPVFLEQEDESTGIPIGIWILLALIVLAIIIILLNQW